PAFAIHEIVAPQVDEALVKARRQQAGLHRRIKAHAPFAQRPRIIEPEALLVLPLQSGPLGDIAKAPLGEEEAAREDITLDEVRARRISGEYLIVDADELDRGPPARPQQPCDALQI